MNDDGEYFINRKKVSKKEYEDFIKNSPVKNLLGIIDSIPDFIKDKAIIKRIIINTNIIQKTEPLNEDLENKLNPIKFEEVITGDNLLSYVLELSDIKKDEIKATYDLELCKLTLKIKGYHKNYIIPKEFTNPKMIYKNSILTINFNKKDYE